MRHLDLFSGIGGFALAAEMVWPDAEHTFCEIEPFAQAVLSKHWPNAKIYNDIRTLTADAERQKPSERTDTRKGVFDSEDRKHIDLLTGGFPCQPFSAAGRRRGTEDDRHLWPEMLRVIREFRPRWVIGENVGGLVTWGGGMVLEKVHLDLESEGYAVQAFIIPAVSLDAPHRRDRIWIVGNAERGGLEGNNGRQPGEKPANRHAQHAPHTKRKRGDEGKRQHPAIGTQPSYSFDGRTGWSENWPTVAARLCRVDDGLPRRLDRTSRLKALGNAIVPQVAAEIMRAIREADA